MRHRVGQIQEERPVLAALDEVKRLVGIALGDEPLVRFLLDHFLHAKQRQRGVVVRLPPRIVAHVVREGDSEVEIEAMARGQERLLVPEVPLPDQRGLIAHILEHLRNGDLVGIETLLIAREQHPLAFLVLVKTHTAGVASGQQGAAGGCAHTR